MSTGNYSSEIGSDSQGYTFNGMPTYYPVCGGEHPSTDYPAPVRAINGGGLGGPGSRVEETVLPPNSSGLKASSNNRSKTMGRGRRKQKKKNTLKSPPADDASITNVNDNLNVTRFSDAGIAFIAADPVYPLPDEVTHNESQTICNSNMLDQILSFKKMMLLQSSEVADFIRKQQRNNLNNK